MPRRKDRQKKPKKPRGKWGKIGAPNSRQRKLWMMKLRRKAKRAIKKYATRKNAVKAAKVGAVMLV